MSAQPKAYFKCKCDACKFTASNLIRYLKVCMGSYLYSQRDLRGCWLTMPINFIIFDYTLHVLSLN
ncbi:hypothetical protein HBA_0260 [Sodalis endosymbiont of Henestaris halophilus]|nr:hypothetical protein HBA_0260 [Sodalis endosymbiont of Henestaris halophilus]